MKVIYTLKLAVYISAIRLHRRLGFKRRLVFALIYIGLPILAGAGLVAILLLAALAKTEASSASIFAESVLVFLSIALPLARIVDVRICFKRIFLNSKTIPTITLEIDDNGIRSESPGVSEGRFFWSAIADFAQSESITLLYVARKKFLFFPTSVLTQTQRAELNDLVARHLPKGKS